jgi:hypothetical protein
LISAAGAPWESYTLKANKPPYFSGRREIWLILRIENKAKLILPMSLADNGGRPNQFRNTVSNSS